MEGKSVLASIDESSTDNDSKDGSISTNNNEDIRDGNYVHPDINRRDARLHIRDHIIQMQVESKWAELPVNRMGNGLHKAFKAVLNKLKK